jgi:hypothetical protein
MKRLVACAALLAILTACQPADTSYTLYRNSALDSTMRIHVASFDTGEGEDYNAENCQVAADLFGRQPGIATRFWCEKGAYRP